MGINDILQNIPNNKTIIFLKGLLRAGKRVDTRNIIMTHDTSDSNVDTTVQSLLGRCCGYGKNKDIEIFCDKISAEKYKNWVESEYDLDLVPDKSKNVISNGIGRNYVQTIYDPIEFDISDILSKMIMDKRKSKENKIKILESLNNDLINSILNNGILRKDYTIGSIFTVDKNKTNTSYKKQYIDVINNKIFLGDFKTDSKGRDPKLGASDDEVGKIVFSAAYEINDKKLLVSFGKITKPIVQTNDKSMYDWSNTCPSKLPSTI
jgi:hypothetical protein